MMGNSEEGKSAKPEKSSAPAVDQNNIQVYPDWAMMQAYYGPRFAVPPYMNSAVASPHGPPPYMWAPMQSMIPPYGAPYVAFYGPGGVYPHPGVPIAGTSLSMDAPMKSPGNTDGGFMKKLKEFDGLAISMGNGNGAGAEHRTSQRLSESEETDGSSDGSNRVTAGHSRKKRSQQGSPDSGDGKALKKSRSFHTAEAGHGPDKMIVKTMENGGTALVPKDPHNENVKPSASIVPQSSMLSETWLQNERELKQERRKQSNRESARRSRLRKQAETEELASKVQTLVSENMTLKSELNKLIEGSEKLRLENVVLMEKLEHKLHKIDDLRLKPVGTVNLLARVNNNDSIKKEDGNSHEKISSGAKLHQLLDAKPRTDAVAAR